ncbi:MAG: biopolymer transporter ExbD [Candidatus Cloacimonetes bacterium]|nr:biopolymer transporter ExbD [Candidatus Cloacimonadota bacterium]
MQLSTNRRKRGAAIINVTSLIDVVLLLLIFFMLTTSFVQQPGMKLDLPKTQSAKVTDDSENVLFISADGKIILNNQPVEITDLGLKLAALIDTSLAENAIVLKADQSINYGNVVEFMETAQQAGFQKLIIATEKK